MRLLLLRNRRIDVRSLWGFLSEREIRGLSSIFGAARKYGSGWIGQAILIGWKCSATLTVKLNYAPNKNSSFFLLHLPPGVNQYHRICSLALLWLNTHNWVEFSRHRVPHIYNIGMYKVILNKYQCFTEIISDEIDPHHTLDISGLLPYIWEFL